MPDNKDITGGQDRERIAAEQSYEVQHIADKLKVSVEQVKKAIETVGNDRDQVEKYLRENGEIED